MSRKQREENEALREEIRVLRESIPRLIEEACGEVREIAQGQGDRACRRAIRAERRNAVLERALARQHAAVDFVTGMTDAATRAALDQAGADYRTWRAEHGLIACRVKTQGVAS